MSPVALTGSERPKMHARREEPTLDGQTPEVLVVGAGVAGLTAARELRAKGRSVCVLEAAERVGGRVRTWRPGHVYGEAGAMVFSEDETEAMALLRSLGIDDFVPLEMHGSDLFLHGRFVHLTRLDGRVAGPSDLAELVRLAWGSWRSDESIAPKLTPRVLLAWRRMIRDVSREAEGISYPHEPGARPGWDDQSFGEFLDRYHPAIKPYVDLQLKVTAGALADDISLFWGLVTFHWNVHGRLLLLRGGMDLLPRALASELGDIVRAGHRATRLTAVDGTLELRVRSKWRERTLRPRAVILATDAGSARRLVPDAPQWKIDALESVSYGAYIPVLLKARQRFWSRELRSGFLNCSGTVFADLMDATKGQPGEEGVLVCFIAGPEAREFIDASDETIRSEVARDLGRLFPGFGYHVTEWLIVRWPRGISYFPPGFAAALRDLRRPHQGIHYGGDYTQGAGLNDAIRAGLAAAGEVEAAFRPPQRQSPASSR